MRFSTGRVLDFSLSQTPSFQIFTVSDNEHLCFEICCYFCHFGFHLEMLGWLPYLFFFLCERGKMYTQTLSVSINMESCG